MPGRSLLGQHSAAQAAVWGGRRTSRVLAQPHLAHFLRNRSLGRLARRLGPGRLVAVFLMVASGFFLKVLRGSPWGTLQTSQLSRRPVLQSERKRDSKTSGYLTSASSVEKQLSPELAADPKHVGGIRPRPRDPGCWAHGEEEAPLLSQDPRTSMNSLFGFFECD